MRSGEYPLGTRVGPHREEALIEPVDLVSLLHDAKKRPEILYVGFADSYKRVHIPHAIFAGQASSPGGLKTLRSLVKALPAKTPIVLYCGCCPIRICPNVHPAYRLLESLKFRDVRILNLQRDFHTDWESKGYPVIKTSLPGRPA